jgi:hypothetical protein
MVAEYVIISIQVGTYTRGYRLLPDAEMNRASHLLLRVEFCYPLFYQANTKHLEI